MKEYWGYDEQYNTREEAESGVNVRRITRGEYKKKFGSNYNTIEFPIYLDDGVILDSNHDWTGEHYHDKETGRDYWPIDEVEIDEDGEFIQVLDNVGYVRV